MFVIYMVNVGILNGTYLIEYMVYVNSFIFVWLTYGVIFFSPLLIELL